MDYKTLTMKLRVHFAISPMRSERKNFMINIKKNFCSHFKYLAVYYYYRIKKVELEGNAK